MPDKSETIECQLFDWNGWDGDMECMIFYNPVLKVQVGKHPAGTKFDSATLMFDKAILQLQNFEKDKDDELHYKPVYIAEYKLKLSIGETISE